MSELLLEVTRAISEADQHCGGDYRKLARAAIEAMTEPTMSAIRRNGLLGYRDMIATALTSAYRKDEDQ